MSEEFDGTAFREWRKQRGIRREDIAAACRVSTVAVHNWENGRNKPHAAIIPILDGMMAGEIAVIPLTGIEERYLDEAVKKGKFESREDFLAATLLKVVSGEHGRVRNGYEANCKTGSSPAPDPLKSLSLVAEEGKAYRPNPSTSGGAAPVSDIETLPQSSREDSA